MLKNVRCLILRIRETYYRKMWLYCKNKELKFERDKDYKTMYEWRDKTRSYGDKQRYVVKRLRIIDL